MFVSEIPVMAAQSSHFFYPFCLRAEQPASRCRQLLFRHDVEGAIGTGGAGYLQHRLGTRHLVDDAALVEKKAGQPYW